MRIGGRRYACADVIWVAPTLCGPWTELPDAGWLLAELARLHVPCVSLSYRAPDVGRLTADLRAAVPGSLQIVVGGMAAGDGNVTRRAIACLLGRPLQRAPLLEAHLRTYFDSRQVRVPEDQWFLAELADGAEPLLLRDSPCPGWLVLRDEAAIVALPAPATLAEALWREHASRRLDFAAPTEAVYTRTLKLVGLPVTEVARRIGPLLASRNPAATLIGSGSDVHLRIAVTAPWGTPPWGRMVYVQPGMDPIRLYRGPDAAARELADRFESRVRALLPYHLYGTNDQALADVVATMLREQGAALAVADAVTFGGVSAQFARSTDVVAGGLAARLEELAGLAAPTLRTQPLEVQAKVLAKTVRERFGAAVGLAVTPHEESSILLAADSRGRVRVEEHSVGRDAVIPYALNLVRKVLLPALECC